MLHLCYMPERERVGVRELRQNLSRWLRRVERGETLEVTERGQPVALLAPLPAARGGAIARLAAQGRLVRAGREPLSALTVPEPHPYGGSISVSEALEQVREDRL